MRLCNFSFFGNTSQRNFMRLTGYFIILIGLAGIHLSCTNRESAVEKATKNKILLFGNQTEPQDLDPHIVTGVPEFQIIESLLEGLTILDPQNLSPLPATASSWEISDNSLVYTFNIRKNAKWSNGDPVKASDFVFSFHRILSPALGSEYAYMLYCIKNAQEFNKSQIDDFSEVGVKAVGDSILQIELCKPVPYFLSLVAHHSWYPVHPPTILKFGSIDTRGTKWTRPENFVGNGPFVLDSWEINKIITVKKSGTYYDNESVSLNGINFYPIENNLTEERSFRTGQLHITSSCPLNKIRWYRSNQPQNLRIDPYLGTYYYLVNVNNKPLDNKNVRKALALAIDRKALTEHVLKGGQLPAASFTPPNVAGYTYGNTLSFDTTEARKLLEEAGYDKNNPFPSVSLLYNTHESHHTIAQAIQQMWKKYLGIDITLINQEWKVYLETTQNHKYDLARMGWISDYNDPNSFLDLWITGGGNNRTGWSNLKYDSLVQAASLASDTGKRFRLFSEAESILLDELPVLPIYFYTNVYLIHTSVKGWTPNILNNHNYKFIDLE